MDASYWKHVYLWIFADNIEDDLGTLNFVIFLFCFWSRCSNVSGIIDINSQIPMIGASGAIGGVLGAYLINYPNARVLVLIPFRFFSQLIKIRAMYVLGFGLFYNLLILFYHLRQAVVWHMQHI